MVTAWNTETTEARVARFIPPIFAGPIAYIGAVEYQPVVGNTDTLRDEKSVVHAINVGNTVLLARLPPTRFDSTIATTTVTAAAPVLTVATAGSQAGNQQGNQAGNQTGTEGGNQGDSQAGNQAGNQAGSQAGNQAGSRQGNEQANQAGNQAGNEGGNQGGNQAGSQGGNQAGNQQGTEQGGNQAWNPADTANSTDLPTLLPRATNTPVSVHPTARGNPGNQSAGSNPSNTTRGNGTEGEGDSVASGGARTKHESAEGGVLATAQPSVPPTPPPGGTRKGSADGGAGGDSPGGKGDDSGGPVFHQHLTYFMPPVFCMVLNVLTQCPLHRFQAKCGHHRSGTSIPRTVSRPFSARYSHRKILEMLCKLLGGSKLCVITGAWVNSARVPFRPLETDGFVRQ